MKNDGTPGSRPLAGSGSSEGSSPTIPTVAATHHDSRGHLIPPDDGLPVQRRGRRRAIIDTPPIDTIEPHDHVDRILAATYTPDGIHRWWHRPRTRLGGRTPAETWPTDPDAVTALAETLTRPGDAT